MGCRCNEEEEDAAAAAVEADSDALLLGQYRFDQCQWLGFATTEYGVRTTLPDQVSTLPDQVPYQTDLTRISITRLTRLTRLAFPASYPVNHTRIWQDGGGSSVVGRRGRVVAKRNRDHAWLWLVPES